MALLLALVCTAAAQEPPRPRLMYHSPRDEMRLLNRLTAGRLAMPLERLGVVRRGEVLYGMARFLAPGRDRDAVRRQALRMIRVSFAGMPDLVQLDVSAVDVAETKERKPATLFSVAARRDRLPLLDPARPPGRQLQAFGRTWFSPEVPEVPPPAPLVGRTLRRALPERTSPSRPGKPV